MPTKLDLDVEITSALPKIQQLTQAIQNAKNEAQQLAQALAQGGASPAQQAQFRQTIGQIQGFEASLATLQNSASVTGRQLVQAANIASGVGLRGVPQADQNALLALTASNLGLLNSATNAAIGANVSLTPAGGGVSAGQVVQQIIQSSQASAMSTGLGIGQPGFGWAVNNGGWGSVGAGGGWSPASRPSLFNNIMNSALFSTPFGRAAMIGAAGTEVTDIATSYLNYQTQRTLQGGDDVMSRYGNIGRIGGSIVGGILGGLTGNPYVLAGGILAGGQIGESALRYIASPEQARQNANIAIAPVLGSLSGLGSGSLQDFFTANTIRSGSRYYVDPFNFNPQGVPNYTSRFGKIGELTNSTLGSHPEFQVTIADTAATFGAISSGLIAGGIDPLSPGDNFSGRYRLAPPYNAGQADLDRAGRELTGSNRRLVPGLASIASGAIKTAVEYVNSYRTYDLSETLGETYTRRLESIFHKAAPDVAKSIAPIFASEMPTGNNVGAILSRYGPEAATTYLRVQNNELISSVDPSRLRDVYAGSQYFSRQSELASLRPLESAAFTRNSLRDQMLKWEQLPDFENNPAWAKAYAGFRSARFAAYAQEDIGSPGPNGTFTPGFAMRDVALQGYQQRLQYMPFAPGNIFGASLSIIQNNVGQIQTLGKRLQNSDLSEQERFSLFSQQQGLLTENARNIGLLSEGFENRLPELRGGTPSFFGRYNSLQGAALNLRGLGSPIRTYGAVGGGQARMQDDFANSFASPGTSNPYSTTAVLNNTNEILTRILHAIEGSGGGGKGASGRTTDVFSRISGGLDQIAEVERQILKFINPGKN